MIKVGDKFKHFDDDFELIGIVKLTGDLHVRNIKNGDEGFMPKKIYYQTQYEQQKQRADELESLLYTYRENSKSIPDLIEKIQASNKRADELENILAYIKSHLNDLWHNGDATEHEYAYNTLKYIESLQEDDNA